MPNTIRHLGLRETRRQATRAAILATATAILEEEGAAAVTLNEVARRLGLRPPSLYEYVAGKNDLLNALFLQEATRLWQAFGQAAAIARPYDRLLAIARTYYTWAMAHKRSYQLLFERPLPHFVPAAEAVEMNSRGRLLVEETLRAHAPGADAERLTLLRWALLHGVCSLHIANTPEAGAYEGPFGALAREILEDLLPGLLDGIGQDETVAHSQEGA